MSKPEARQTPLPDLLDRLPEDIVLGIKGDEPVFPSYTNIPIGALARQAAAELRRLYQLAMDQQGEIYALKMARSMEQKTAALKRDALLEALKEAVEVCIWPSTAFSNAFDKARAAINKAVEEGK